MDRMGRVGLRKKRHALFLRDCPEFDFTGTRIIRCRYCRDRIDRAAITVDHIIPVSKGGTNALENLCLACKLCNLRKADQILEPKEATRQ